MLKNSRVFIFDLFRILLFIPVLHLHLRILVLSPVGFLTRFEYYSVPLFLVLSFYLTSKYFLDEPIPQQKVKARLKRLLVPLVFWSLFGFLPHLNIFTVPNMFLQFFSGSVVNTPLYYLNLLIVFTLLMTVLTYVKQSIRKILFLLIIPLAYFLQYSTMNYVFFSQFVTPVKLAYGRTIELIPYVMLGVLFGFLSSNLLKNWKLSFALFLVGVIGYIVTIRIPFPSGFAYQGLSWFFGSLTIFLLVLQTTKLALEEYVGVKMHTFINQLGKYIFGIYLFHYAVLELLLKFFPGIRSVIISYTNAFILLFIVICFVFCFLFDKLTNYRFSMLIS